MGASKPKGSSNKKQIEKKKGDNSAKSDNSTKSDKSGDSSKSGDEESKRKEYEKALHDLKLEWFKYVDTHNTKRSSLHYVYMTCTLILCFRSGVVSADELDGDTMDSVDFLTAKLKQIQSEKVSLCCNIYI